MALPKWHFFTYGTDMHDIVDILKSGKINSTEIEDYFLDNPQDEYYKYAYFKHVYCHYIFDKIPAYKTLSWAYTNTILVIDPTIAKDYKMIICKNLNYGCKPTDKKCLMHTTGNLSKIPSMQKVRTYILKTIDGIYNNAENTRYVKTWEDIVNSKNKFDAYKYSHEVLFDTVPISYIRAILIPNKEKKGKYIHPIQEYIEQNNLPIKLIFYPTTTNIDFHTLFEQI